MRRLSFALLLCLFAIANACSVEEPQRDPDLVSKWELIETLQNDGSQSVYKPANHSETVAFLVDLKVKRSTSWCTEANVNVAEYSPEESKILIGCGEEALSMNYAIKGNLLFIYPNCIEECALKYRRIDNLVGFVR